MFEVFDNHGSTSFMYQRSKWPFPHFRLGHFRNVNPRPLFNTIIFLIGAKYGLRNHFWPLESDVLMREKKAPAEIFQWMHISWTYSLSWSIGYITTYWENCVVHLSSFIRGRHSISRVILYLLGRCRAKCVGWIGVDGRHRLMVF